MANYSKVIPLTLMYEGGNKYTNIPQDSGGPTKYGVCLKFAADTNDELFDINGDGRITKEDIKLITEDIAVEGFKKYFWDRPYKLDNMESDKKAFVIFDAAVNHGAGNATRFIQRACNRIGMKCGVDGKFGPQTNRCMNDAAETAFIEAFLYERESFYKSIVERRPSQSIFLRGWLNRIKNIRRDLKTL